MEKVKDLDLYLLLDLESDADAAAIKKAYRKKALTCHPDKNPDNPKAAELFHQLSDALSVLTDEKARAAYDNLLKARKANDLRNRQLDAKRRKLKDDLEAREKAAFDRSADTVKASRNLKAEIERLQREGRKQLEEEQEKLKDLLKNEQFSHVVPNQPSQNVPAKLKLKWKESKHEEHSYDSEVLRRIFCKYGDVGEVIVLPSKKKSGSHSGLVEMMSESAARMAANIEQGFPENPLKVKLIGDDNQSTNHGQKAFAHQTSNVTNFNDFETLVMRQLRQEEERKRLIEEMKRQDALEDS